MTPRRLVTIGASLALHGGLLLAVLLAVRGEPELGTLFIDLTEHPRPDAAGGAVGRRADTRASRAGAHSLRSIVAPRSAPAPSNAPAAAEPSPAAEPSASRDSGGESPAPPASEAAPVPVEAAAEQAPRAPNASDASPPGASGAPHPSSGGAGPEAPVTASGMFSERGVRGGAPGGAPDVSHGFALAVGGDGADGPSGPGAEYGAYLARLRARVQQSLRYPLAARRRGLSGTVHVEVVIRPDGAIGAVAVADSSSHAVLDEAAVEAIRRLAREPFPSDVSPRTLRVRLPVVFALE